MKQARKEIWHRAAEISKFTAEIQRLVKKNPEIVRVQNRIEFLLTNIFNNIKAIQGEVPNIETFLVDPRGLEIVGADEVTTPVSPLEESA